MPSKGCFPFFKNKNTTLSERMKTADVPHIKYLDDFTDTLQDEGLFQLEGHYINFCNWDATTVFGRNSFRNENHEKLYHHLLPIYKKAMKRTNIDIDQNLIGFVSHQLAHHIMKYLLAPRIEEQPIKLSELIIDNKDGRRHLPRYSKRKIYAFRGDWTKIDQHHAYNVDSTDDDVKNILSDRLAQRIIHIVKTKKYLDETIEQAISVFQAIHRPESASSNL